MAVKKEKDGKGMAKKGERTVLSAPAEQRPSSTSTHLWPFQSCFSANPAKRPPQTVGVRQQPSAGLPLSVASVFRGEDDDDEQQRLTASNIIRLPKAVGLSRLARSAALKTSQADALVAAPLCEETPIVWSASVERTKTSRWDKKNSSATATATAAAFLSERCGGDEGSSPLKKRRFLEDSTSAECSPNLENPVAQKPPNTASLPFKPREGAIFAPASSAASTQSAPAGTNLASARLHSEEDGDVNELVELRKRIQARAIAVRAIEKLNLPKQTGAPSDDALLDLEPNSDPTEYHKMRAEEMEKTKLAAREATVKAKGKHHMFDFLPEEEKERFLAKLMNARSGRPEELVEDKDKSAFADNKLTEENKGFQILQKMGWSTGSGLGTSSQGITAPIGPGRSTADGSGLGLADDANTDISAGDDLYSAYRKKMMLAYKHRPNPLNNPRRKYY